MVTILKYFHLFNLLNIKLNFIYLPGVGGGGGFEFWGLVLPNVVNALVVNDNDANKTRQTGPIIVKELIFIILY